ncbi:MAG: ABC transporter ATP-binding protein [Bacteroidia bacterium]|nr:ABC transporter ATP-binding protein [Bacteroidia bacterium]
MLELKNINKRLGDFNLKNISFSVRQGEYFALLGPSGAGKSIVLELLAGLIEPDKGEIFLNGENITTKNIHQRNLGIVFQDLSVFPHLSVAQNIVYPLNSQKITKQEKKAKVQKIAEEFNILHLLDRKPATLSGGELQRVAIARTLIKNPSCLLLDEPLGSLDTALKNDFKSMLRRLKGAERIIVHVTHDYEEAVSLADKIAVIHNGSIIQSGTPDEVFQNPGSEFVAGFTGIKNFFRTELIEEAGGDSIATINGQFRIYLTSAKAGEKGFVMIRSEDIIISEKKLESSLTNQFEGNVEEIYPTPAGIEVVVNAGVMLTARITNTSYSNLAIRKGQKLWVSFKATAVRFILS